MTHLSAYNGHLKSYTANNFCLGWDGICSLLWAEHTWKKLFAFGFEILILRAARSPALEMVSTGFKGYFA